MGRHESDVVYLARKKIRMLIQHDHYFIEYPCQPLGQRHLIAGTGTEHPDYCRDGRD
jgi:hypothetical protein